MRADKYLSNSGIASRKKIKTLIREGRVTVNGKPLSDCAARIDEDGDCVCVDEKRVVYKKFVYLMLNKPAGYVSAVYDKIHPAVTALVPEEFAHYGVFPVGRLDIDTEGLLLLTNDGALSHRLLSPKNHVDKTYFVRCENPIETSCGDAFSDGVVLDDGYRTMSADTSLLPDERECLLTIREGKFHQVKRMFEAVGNRVVYLKRIKMGSLCLDESLSPGAVRELRDEERALLEKGGV